jgi:hypothetical protein
MNAQPFIRSAFRSAADEFSDAGIRPVILDVLGADGETSLLPDSLKMVLHVNPSTMQFQYQRVVERIPTKGGFVEQHWGEAPVAINFDLATGGFMRLYTGLSNITGPTSAGGYDAGGTRRDTIAYDKYLDMLALFHNNGAVYDSSGTVVFTGCIRIIFDGSMFDGWFNNFSMTETADKPYQFALTTSFTVKTDHYNLRTTYLNNNADRLSRFSAATGPTQGQKVG